MTDRPDWWVGRNWQYHRKYWCDCMVGRPPQGPMNSYDTCSVCLYDQGYKFQSPGTPVEQGCQDCLPDTNGQMRCSGCWTLEKREEG